MTKPSTHLYSKENRELYRDTLDQYNQLFCLLGRNLSFYLESATKASNPQLLRHIKKCPTCQREVSIWRKKMRQLEEQIPRVAPSAGTRELIRSECHQILELLQKRMNSRTKEARPKFFKASRQKFQAAGKEIFHILTSKELFKGILLAGVVGLVAAFVLN